MRVGVRGVRSVVLALLAWPLFGLGLVVAEAGSRQALALLVPAGVLLAAAGATILRDRDDIANHMRWGWSTIGQGRHAGIAMGLLLVAFGVGVSTYGVIAAAEAFT
jgi:hypothetical protein